MISIKNLSVKKPFTVFNKKYEDAKKMHQKKIEIACISSFSKKNNEINARFVNIKFLIDNKFIFFSNYDSEKAIEFKEHSQVAITFFWNKVNTQIRIKANVEKTSNVFNQRYFEKRDKDKNALAISSHQSKLIDSYDDVAMNHQLALQAANLSECPEFWGGYLLDPYYFEFWEGHDSRLNRRDVYKLNGSSWTHFYLQP